MPKIEISVVIPTYNRAELLGEVLGALAVQSLDSSRFEVLIVDNNSTDETGQICREFCESHSQFRYLLETQQGTSFARNRGWKEASGEIVAFIDDDARASVDWCQNILNAFRNSVPKADAVGGDVYPWHKVEPPKWLPDDFGKVCLGEAAGVYSGSYGFLGANMAIKRKVLNVVGGFDESLGVFGDVIRWGEDTRMTFRLRELGFTLWYEPGMIVDHYVRECEYTIKYQFIKGIKVAKHRRQANRESLSFTRRFAKFFKIIFYIIYSSVKILLFDERKAYRFLVLSNDVGKRTGYISC